METPEFEMDYASSLADYTAIFQRMYDELPSSEIRRCVPMHFSTLYRIRHPKNLDRIPEISLESMASLFFASISLGYPALTPQRLLREWMHLNSQRVMHMGLMSGLQYESVPRAILKYLSTDDIHDHNTFVDNFLLVADPAKTWKLKYEERDEVLLRQRDLLPGMVNHTYEKTASEALKSSWGEAYGKGRDATEIIEAALGGKKGVGSVDNRSRRLIKLKMLGDPEEAQRKVLRRYDNKLRKLRDEDERLALDREKERAARKAKAKEKAKAYAEYEALETEFAPMPLPVLPGDKDAPRPPRSIRPGKGKAADASDAALLEMFGGGLIGEDRVGSVLSQLEKAERKPRK